MQTGYINNREMQKKLVFYLVFNANLIKTIKKRNACIHQTHRIITCAKHLNQGILHIVFNVAQTKKYEALAMNFMHRRNFARFKTKGNRAKRVQHLATLRSPLSGSPGKLL